MQHDDHLVKRGVRELRIVVGTIGARRPAFLAEHPFERFALRPNQFPQGSLPSREQLFLGP